MGKYVKFTNTDISVIDISPPCKVEVRKGAELGVKPHPHPTLYRGVGCGGERNQQVGVRHTARGQIERLEKSNTHIPKIRNFFSGPLRSIFAASDLCGKIRSRPLLSISKQANGCPRTETDILSAEECGHNSINTCVNSILKSLCPQQVRKRYGNHFATT